MQGSKFISCALISIGLIACSSNRAPSVASDSANNPYQKTASTVLTNSVFFPFNSAEVPTTSAKLLTINASYLIAHPAAHLQIQGNSSEIGTAQYNQGLAATRAQNIKQALLKLGVPAHQLSTVSYGDSKPVYPNATNGHQPKNQRADLVYTATPPFQYKLNKVPSIDSATMY